MRIVIAGLAKSGTTGLYYRIRNSLPGRVSAHFECHLAPEADGRHWDHVLAKIIYRADRAQLDSFRPFEKKIAIIRDPRDRLVSAVLHGCGAHCPYPDDGPKVQAVLDMLRRKESGEDVSLMELINLHRRNSGRPEIGPEKDFGWFLAHETQLLDDLGDYVLFRYDNLVEQDFADLEAYLGLELSGSPEVDPVHGGVVRTRRSGSWRHWLTPRDVAFLRDVFDPVLAAMGWDPSWDLAKDPVIRPAHGSDYYLSLVEACRDARKADRALRASPDFRSQKEQALTRIMGPDWKTGRDRD